MGKNMIWIQKRKFSRIFAEKSCASFFVGMKKFPENIFVGDSIFLLEKKTLKRGFRRSERVDGKGAKKERVKRSEVRGK